MHEAVVNQTGAAMGIETDGETGIETAIGTVTTIVVNQTGMQITVRATAAVLGEMIETVATVGIETSKGIGIETAIDLRQTGKEILVADLLRRTIVVVGIETGVGTGMETVIDLKQTMRGAVEVSRTDVAVGIKTDVVIGMGTVIVTEAAKGLDHHHES